MHEKCHVKEVKNAKTSRDCGAVLGARAGQGVAWAVFLSLMSHVCEKSRPIGSDPLTHGTEAFMNSHVAQVAQAWRVEFGSFVVFYVFCDGIMAKSLIQVELMDVKTDVQQDPVLGMTIHAENDGTVRNIRYRQASKIVEALFTAGC